MTAKSTAGAASKGAAPRGSAASSEVVEVYKILVEAGEPLTVPQIAERMPRTGYVSAAMQKYREHKEKTDPTWLDGKSATWSKPAQDEAFMWWVRAVVRSGVHYKKFIVNAKPVQNMYGTVKEGTYLPGTAPMVRHHVWVETVTLAPWSPELQTELVGGQVAGMQFLNQLDEFERLGKKPKATEMASLLKLAEQAIRKNH